MTHTSVPGTPCMPESVMDDPLVEPQRTLLVKAGVSRPKPKASQRPSQTLNAFGVPVCDVVARERPPKQVIGDTRQCTRHRCVEHRAQAPADATTEREGEGNANGGYAPDKGEGKRAIHVVG